MYNSNKKKHRMNNLLKVFLKAEGKIPNFFYAFGTIFDEKFYLPLRMYVIYKSEFLVSESLMQHLVQVRQYCGHFLHEINAIMF